MVGFYWDMQWKKNFNIKKGMKRDIEKKTRLHLRNET